MTHSRPEYTGSPFTSSARLVVSRAVSLDDSLVLLFTFYTRTLNSLFLGIAMPSHLMLSLECEQPLLATSVLKTKATSTQNRTTHAKLSHIPKNT